MSAGDPVHVFTRQRPGDYHCTCRYCTEQVIGELRMPNGEYYSRLERKDYYAPEETRKENGDGHIAKTPLHVARWAIQAYSKVGDWVLDPTIGAGTTAVEALTQGRHAAGMEIEYSHILEANIRKVKEHLEARDCKARVASGDARNIRGFFDQLDEGLNRKRTFQLVVNNPPYSGDVSAYPKRDADGNPTENVTYQYDSSLPNLAHLKEGDAYWEALEDIYEACIERMELGAHFVVGVKDMTRNKTPYLLHYEITELLEDMGLTFVGSAFLRHHPGTLHLNRAIKEGNKAVPLYQTITVLRKMR
jgi:hypothetical protein